MNCRYLSILTVALALSSFHAFGEASPDADAVQKRIDTLYDFHPRQLTGTAFTDKSNALDAFWADAKAQPNLYVPVIRNDLKNLHGSPFFFYDGSKLLMSLSDTAADRHIAIAAIAHAEFVDLQPTDYLRTVHGIAVRDEDTSEAAFHVLEKSDFKAFIPQHALTLGQDYSLIYMLLPENPKYWEAGAIALLASEKDPTAQNSLLKLLYYAQDSQADAAIKRFSTDATAGAENRTFAAALLEKERHPGIIANLSSISGDEATIRRKRQQTMASISDEALDDLDLETSELAAVRKDIQ